jgi:predicted enzyme related to lactoylglutathione lyase
MNQSQDAVRIEAILIETDQLESLAAFYQAGLQLDAPIPVGQDILGFQVGDHYLGIERVRLRGGMPPGAVSLWFRVADIVTTMERLVEHGATVQSGPTAMGEDQMIAVLHDPDGNRIGLLSGRTQ